MRPRVAQHNLPGRGLETHCFGTATRSQTEMTPHSAITGILYKLNRAGRNSSSFFLHVNRGSLWFYSAYSANYPYTEVATKIFLWMVVPWCSWRSVTSTGWYSVISNGITNYCPLVWKWVVIFSWMIVFHVTITVVITPITCFNRHFVRLQWVYSQKNELLFP